VPVFVGGRLMGYRRKTNDALLMFCLRHYGHDAEGRRTTIAYYSAAAMAGAGVGAGARAGEGAAEGAGAVAQASATVRTVTRGRARSGRGQDQRGHVVTAVESDAGDPHDPGATERAERQDALAAALRDFGGVTLDATATAAIAEAVEACAARRREGDARLKAGGDDAIAQALDDGRPGLVKVGWRDEQHWGQFEPSYADNPADAFGDARCYEDELGSDVGMDPRFLDELPWSCAGVELPELPGSVPPEDAAG